jgi:hypothetical protein
MAAREARLIANDIFAQLTSRGLDGKQAITVVTEIIALITNDLGNGESASGTL